MESICDLSKQSVVAFVDANVLVIRLASQTLNYGRGRGNIS